MVPVTVKQSVRILVACCLLLGEQFLVVDALLPASLHLGVRPLGPVLFATVDAGTTMRSWTLPKPLGLILEEVEKGAARGVRIERVQEGGSAVAHAEELTGCQLATVQGTDVTTMAFDDVMQLIIDAPDTLELQVLVPAEAESSPESTTSWDVGTPVTIRYQQPGAADLELSAAVGDNLRKVLLDNGVEVYQGLKQKLGNCGGGGTCTFCAVDVLESEGWVERSDYEDSKLAKFPQARLACLNNIQGPATIRKTQR